MLQLAKDEGKWISNKKPGCLTPPDHLAKAMAKDTCWKLRSVEGKLLLAPSSPPSYIVPLFPSFVLARIQSITIQPATQWHLSPSPSPCGEREIKLLA